MKEENEFETNEIHNLEGRKKQAKSLMQIFLSSKEKDKKQLDKIMSLDDTLPDVYLFKLKNCDNIKLMVRSFDILDKELLFQFKIEKKINFKELYFELINYIESIKLDEPENANEKFELEDFIDDKNEEPENNQSSSYSDIEENEISSNNTKIEEKDKLKVDFEEISELKENLSAIEFKNILEKKMNFCTEDILIKNEKLKVPDIKIKFSKIYEGCFSFLNYRNNYPNLESELFYFNSLRYMLDTYKSLKYKRFICKIQLLLHYEYSILYKFKSFKAINIEA